MSSSKQKHPAKGPLKKASRPEHCKVWLHGASGKMGLEIQRSLSQRSAEFRLMGGSGQTFSGDSLLTGRPVTADKLAHALSHAIDVVIDFSVADGNAVLLSAMKKVPVARRPQVLIGTTGLSTKALKGWSSIAAELPSGGILLAPNTSRGILALIKGAQAVQKSLAGTDTDLAIVETHHRMKKDAPSGTAKLIAEQLTGSNGGRKSGIEISAIRGGGVFGEHEVCFMGKNDDIILTHRAYSRGLFAEGALDLARWLHDNRKKFRSTMLTLDDFAASF